MSIGYIFGFMLLFMVLPLFYGMLVGKNGTGKICGGALLALVTLPTIIGPVLGIMLISSGIQEQNETSKSPWWEDMENKREAALGEGQPVSVVHFGQVPSVVPMELWEHVIGITVTTVIAAAVIAGMVLASLGII